MVETVGVNDYVDFSLNKEEALEKYGVMYNGNKTIIGFRVGAGSTYTVQNGKSYSTGKAYEAELLSASMFKLDWANRRAYNNITPLFNETTAGDSGSGLYIYDNEKKQWVLMGTLSG